MQELSEEDKMRHQIQQIMEDFEDSQAFYSDPEFPASVDSLYVNSI